LGNLPSVARSLDAGFSRKRQFKLSRHRGEEISILGSTGSIGRQTLAVVEAMPGRLVCLHCAGSNLEELSHQIRATIGTRFCRDAGSGGGSRQAAPALGVAKLPEIQHGHAGLTAVATHPMHDSGFPQPSA